MEFAIREYRESEDLQFFPTGFTELGFGLDARNRGLFHELVLNFFQLTCITILRVTQPREEGALDKARTQWLGHSGQDI